MKVKKNESEAFSGSLIGMPPEVPRSVKHEGYRWLWLIIMIVLFLSSVVMAASVGSADLSIADSLKIIVKRVPLLKNFIDTSGIRPVYDKIIFQVRLPRIFMSALTGGGLALVGAVFQGVFRNPLADPHILGISSGAACGATIAVLTGITLNFMGLGVVGVFAFAGALLTMLLVYRIACVGDRLPVINLLLTGTAVSSMLSAVISLLMAMNRSGIEKVYMWTLGSFSSASWMKVSYLSVFVLVCGGILLFFGRELNLLATGEETAESLGVDTVKLKKIIIVTASFLVAAAVSVSGIIGFVGLIVPHCVRLVAGPDHKKVLPFSLFGGAVFMILCDSIARTIIAPSEIPVGVVTSILGAPYFIFLIGRNKEMKAT